jgi:hypothetical protein
MYAIYDVKGNYYLSGKDSAVKIFKTKEHAIKRLERYVPDNLFVVKVSLNIDGYIDTKH